MGMLMIEPFDGYAYADIAQIFTQAIFVQGGDNDGFVNTNSIRPGKNYLKMDITGGAGGKTSKSYRFVPQFPPASGNVYIQGFRFLGYGYSVLFGPTNDPLSNLPSASLGTARLNGTTQCWIRVNLDGTISAVRGGGTVLGSSTVALPSAIWTYIEVKITVHTTAGTVDVKFDGVTRLSLSGVNTAGAGSNGWNETMLPIISYNGASQGAAQFQVMDYYLADGSGTIWNNFMGDMRCDYVLPNAAGSNNMSTPSAGTDRSLTVDDNPMNADTDYNTFANINDIDTYNFPNAPVTGAAILGVETRTQIRKTDTGSAGIKHAILVNGSTYLSATEQGITSSYSVVRQAWPVNPDTGSAWTDTGISGFNAAEFGLKKTS